MVVKLSLWDVGWVMNILLLEVDWVVKIFFVYFKVSLVKVFVDGDIDLKLKGVFNSEECEKVYQFCDLVNVGDEVGYMI